MKPPPDQRALTPDIDVLVRSPLWRQQPAAEKTVRAAIAAALTAANVADAEAAVVLTDDQAIRALNRDWRGIDRSTNVLSFPAKAPKGMAGRAPLGDIVIAYETLKREAEAECKPFAHHLAHLTVHGFLHLIGYDHQTDAEADAMEAHEREILAQLEIPDPYRLPQTGDA